MVAAPTTAKIEPAPLRPVAPAPPEDSAGLAALEVCASDIKGWVLAGTASQAKEPLRGSAAPRHLDIMEPDGQRVRFELRPLLDLEGDRYLGDSFESGHEELFGVLAHRSPIGIYIIQDGVFVYQNPRFEGLTGYSADELKGRPSLSLVLPEDREHVRRAATSMLKGEDRPPYEYRITRSSGEVRWVMETTVSITHRGRRAALGNYMDVTERKQLEEELTHEALFDSLTSLPNRRQFLDRLDQALAPPAASESRPKIAVLFLDLDDFKEVNDCLGHSVGDRLLELVACRLKAAVRRDDMVARLGGDEFTIIAAIGRTASSATSLSQRLIKSVSRPYNIDGFEVRISLSVGISVGRCGTARPEEMLRQADIALYRAKGSGKGRYAMFGDTSSPAPA